MHIFYILFTPLLYNIPKYTHQDCIVWRYVLYNNKTYLIRLFYYKNDTHIISLHILSLTSKKLPEFTNYSYYLLYAEKASKEKAERADAPSAIMSLFDAIDVALSGHPSYGFDLHFHSFGNENKGVATGMLHLSGFESALKK